MSRARAAAALVAVATTSISVWGPRRSSRRLERVRIPVLGVRDGLGGTQTPVLATSTSSQPSWTFDVTMTSRGPSSGGAPWTKAFSNGGWSIIGGTARACEAGSHSSRAAAALAESGLLDGEVFLERLELPGEGLKRPRLAEREAEIVGEILRHLFDRPRLDETGIGAHQPGRAGD